MASVLALEGVHINLLEKDRAVGDIPVNHLCRRHLGNLPLKLDNLDAENPSVVRVNIRKRHDAFHALLEAGAVDKVDTEIRICRHRALRKVRMGVDETRHDELVSIVSDIGRGADE